MSIGGYWIPDESKGVCVFCEEWPAIAFCDDCDRPICSHCAYVYNGLVVCAGCFDDRAEAEEMEVAD